MKSPAGSQFLNNYKCKRCNRIFRFVVHNFLKFVRRNSTQTLVCFFLTLVIQLLLVRGSIHSSIKVVISRLSKLASTRPEVRNRLVKIEYLASTANKLLHCKMKHIQPIGPCWAEDSNPGFSAYRANDFQIKLFKLSANIFSQIFTCRQVAAYSILRVASKFREVNIGHRI